MRQKVAWLMLLFVANAQRSLQSVTCEAPCKPDEFKADPLVVLCGGGRCSTTVSLDKGKTLNMISLPVGTPGVELTMAATDDWDLELRDGTDDACIAGICAASFEGRQGCNNIQDYCLAYEGMDWYFTGDRQNAADSGSSPEEAFPVIEMLKTLGNTTRPLYAQVQASSSGQARVSAINGAFMDCPEVLPGCQPCSEYTGCNFGGTPLCDGSATVTCLLPTTTSSTRTIVSSTVTSSTTRTSTSQSATSSTVTFTSTYTGTKTSTTSRSTTSLTQTVTSATSTKTTTLTTTRSSLTITTTPTTSSTWSFTSSSTGETGTSSTGTSVTSSSSTVTSSSTSSLTFTRTSSTSLTTSSSKTTSTTGTSTSRSSSSTSLSTLTVTSTSSITQSSTVSSISTSSTSRSHSSTTSESSTSRTRSSTTLTHSSSSTATTSSSSSTVSSSVTRTGTTSKTTSTSSSRTQTVSLTQTTMTSTSETATWTSSSTTDSSTTESSTTLSETSSSITQTKTTTSITSTVTCGCCSSCLGWASALGCGSAALCERNLEECQADLRGARFGLEECRKREEFLEATIVTMSSPNCTSFVAEESDDSAVWVLVVLVLLLLITLLILLLLCWRLRQRHNALKEQLAQCKDELFTSPTHLAQDRPEQRQVRKLQRSLDEAKKKLAAKEELEIKLSQLQEQLKKEQSNGKQGQDLWKLNRSMYHILRQVVQDSRDFAREVKEDSEKARSSPKLQQRSFLASIQKFEAQLALTAGRRDAAEAELAGLVNKAQADAALPSEVDTCCDSESPVSFSTGLGRRVKVPTPIITEVLESPRPPAAVVPNTERDAAPAAAAAPGVVERDGFTSVAPTAAVLSPPARTLVKQESRIEEVIAQRLEITPHNLRSSLRQAGQKNKDGSTLLPLQRVLSKRLDEAKVQPGEEPTEPMTDQA